VVVAFTVPVNATWQVVVRVLAVITLVTALVGYCARVLTGKLTE